MKAAILRLDAPLLSFGTVMVDQHGFIDRFPGTSMLTGLLANALGWDHSDFDRLQILQERVQFAARWDVAPERIIDYHTVDLGQPGMARPGWTTRGRPEHRAGGPARLGTHQRYRHYWMDGLMTVALAVGTGSPDVDALVAALRRPARPIFLGRKTCLPARPLLDPRTPIVDAPDVLRALAHAPAWDRRGALSRSTTFEACWPADVAGPPGAEVRRVFDLRAWADQLPAGSRWRAEGSIGG
jgi:CRISPR system Cascade subunit CasD